MSSDAYITQLAERPDLAAIPVANPEGFIGHQVLPILPVLEKAGSLAYATIPSVLAGQTGRSAGVAPTRTLVSNSVTTYSAAELIARKGITPDEAKQMGGIEKADEVGAKAAKRDVMITHEGKIAYNLLGGSVNKTFDPGTFYTDVQVALDAMRYYEGKRLVVASSLTMRKLWTALLNNNAFSPSFARIVSGTNPGTASTGLEFQQIYDALAMWLGVDGILRGPDFAWDSTNADGDISGRLSVCVADDGMDPLSHKWKPVLGKCVHFLPDGKQEFLMRTAYDQVSITNLYDASLWYDVKLFNTGANYIFGSISGV